MGIFTLGLLMALELFFLVWSIRTKDAHREEKAIISIALLALFGVLLITGIYEWGFRYVMLLVVLIIYAIVSATILIKKKEKPYTVKFSVVRLLRNSFIFTFALLLAIVFPQYAQPETTGTYEVEKTKVTWVDESRLDPFSTTGENRALTVEFYYPKSSTGEKSGETYPLVVFSHGAFGFSGSNYSTFAELASNGYVVASIGHTSQAFYVKDTSGKVTIVDTDFINKAAEINGIEDTEHEEDIYDITREWMKLRTEDAHFVIESILEACTLEKGNAPFERIDTDKIGMMGHSLGGATSAQMGRERDDIDAVIVLDGTMLGEEIAFENNTLVLNDSPYPVPLLNLYAEDHYNNSKKYVGDAYDNFYASQNAVCAYETVFKGAGHLNFTDLPLFSPPLAKMLGVGTMDARYGIETMNRVVLEFFNGYLKDGEVPIIEKEY